MFFGKNQTGNITQQQPAVNMVNQPDMMNQPEGMYPTQSQMAGMYQTPDMMGGMQQTPDMMGGMQQTPDMMGGMHGMHHTPGMMDGMYPTQQHMGYVCDPCYCVPCEPQEPEPQPQVYVVQKGDTVYKIAKKFGLDWRELAGYNHLGNPDLIYPGERLFIPPRY